MGTIELKELDICEGCKYRELDLIRRDEYYSGGFFHFGGEPYVICKRFDICEGIEKRVRDILLRQIAPEGEEGRENAQDM